ncbi:hypothetical protein BJ138DRAFT_1143969 [Hygrophoropsis aurantiaca]|uniref:Uncharacterized protein n=1 Tax=Hygrophoropsis aurantiaca TaxID=72124 RepID=A0ACB8AN23_9AGAM|nr:hypothetical protein BJ138DRAFT_1143969 [Hygrophoropsis aurantiaca]
MRKDQSNVTEPVVNGEDSRGIPVQLGARLSEPSPIVARPSGSIANFQASAISPSFLENLRSHQLVAPLDGPLVLPATLSCGASITSIRHPPSSNVAETQTTALHTVHPKVVMPGSLSHYNSIVRERRKTGSPHSGASSASSSKDSAIPKETEKPSLSFGAASTTKPNASAPPTGLPTRPDITRRSPAGGRPASLLTRGHLSAAPSYAYPPAPMMPGSLQDGEDASQSWNKKSPSTQGIGSELFHF